MFSAINYKCSSINRNCSVTYIICVNKKYIFKQNITYNILFMRTKGFRIDLLYLLLDYLLNFVIFIYFIILFLFFFKQTVNVKFI